MDERFRIVSKPSGLTVWELLVSMSIISLLLMLLLPALGSARESARRIGCTDHLRQIGLSMHNHHAAMNHLPTGWTFDPTKTSAYGWAVALLPYLEQTSLADRIDPCLPLDHPQHDMARQTALEVMLCPSDLTQTTFMLFEVGEEEEEASDGIIVTDAIQSVVTMALLELPTANYVGVFGTIEPDDTIPAPLGDGTFLENRRVRFRDFQRGLSHTMVVGERTMAQVPSTWIGVDLAGEDAAARLVGSALQGINHPIADECDYSSRHPGGASFLWGDGHVSFISENVDLLEYHRSAQLRDKPHHIN